jgi:O-antigen ligase
VAFAEIDDIDNTHHQTTATLSGGQWAGNRRTAVDLTSIQGRRMRRIAWFLLLLFAFAIPWEYSLDLGAPLGHIARLVGLALLLAAVPAVCETGRLRAPGPLQWLALGFFLWFCCSVLWTVDRTATLTTLRGYFQVIMVVWLVGEFAGSAEDLRALLRACVAGSWVLAVLTLANLYSPEAIAAGQIRFAATGQDPNDVARFLDLSFPLAALLWTSESRWPWRLLGAGYLPLGLVGVLLTGSRGGFLAAVAALAGSVFLLVRRDPRKVLAGTLVLPVIAAVFWLAVPHETLGRLATISQQLGGGDLNQRLNIWDSGWHAFVRAPFFGTGAGTFVAAAGLAPIDTAQYGALDWRHRRAGGAVSGCGHCGLVHLGNARNQGSGPLGHGDGAGGLGHHLPGFHGGREPHDLAATGPDCAGRTAGCGRTGADGGLLPGRRRGFRAGRGLRTAAEN